MWMSGELKDDGVKSHQLRQDIVDFAEAKIAATKGALLRAARLHVTNEMKDDPFWDSDVPFQWPTYFAWCRRRTTFVTFFLIKSFVEKTGYGVIVMRRLVSATTGETDLVEVWKEQGSISNVAPMKVVIAAKHYKILWPGVVKDIGQSMQSKKRNTPETPSKTAPSTKKAKADSGPTSCKKRPAAAADPCPPGIRKKPAAAADFGICFKCGAKMKPVPPPPEGGEAMIGCSAFRSGKCRGYLRNVLPHEERMLPRVWGFIARLT